MRSVSTASDAGNGLTVALAVILGAVIHVQATLPLGTGEIRLNLADPLAAMIAAWGLLVIIRDPGRFTHTVTPPLLICAAMFTLALTISVFIGISATGSFTAFAMIKYAGWFAVLCYLLTGVVIARNLAARDGFILALCLSLAVLALIQLISQFIGLTVFPSSAFRFHGLAGNPNAMSLLLIAGFTLSVAPAVSGTLLLRRLLLATAVLNLTGILLTGSLAAFLALPVLLPFLLALGVPWQKLIGVLLVAAILVVPTRMHLDDKKARFGSVEKFGTLMQGTKGDARLYDITIDVRLAGLRRGLAEWWDHPLFGVGLGVDVFNERQRHANPKDVVTIHNTPIWLLAETGLFGFLSLAALFLFVLKTLIGRALSRNRRLAVPGSLPLATALVLVTALLMSMAHELMYQRIIWMLTGLALATSWAERIVHSDRDRNRS